MRPIANFTIHAVTATALIALAATASAAADKYLKLGDTKSEASKGSHDGQIEVESISWGATRQAGMLNPVFVKSWSTSGDVDPLPAAGATDINNLKTSSVKPQRQRGEWIGDVERPKATGAGTSTRTLRTTSGDDGRAGVGGSQDVTVGGAQSPSFQPSRRQHVSIQAGPDGSSARRTPPSVTLKRGEKGGTADINIGVGELQEMTISKSMDSSTPKLAEYAVKGKVFRSPAPQGSVTVVGRFAQCRVGARYPTVGLGDGTKRYKLVDVIVTDCGRSMSGGRTIESMSLNYSKVVL